MLKEFILIFCLMVLNGVFVMAEFALVAARKVRLEKMAKHGNRSARLALRLSEKPQYFLSIIQIFITLIGIVAGAYGGGTQLADWFAEMYERIPFIQEYARTLGVATMVTIITYLSLVIGELVPKTLGLSKPEKVSVTFSPFIQVLGWITAPIQWFLQISARFVLFVLRTDKTSEPVVTEEELQEVIEQGSIYGLLEKKETEMLKGVIRIGDRKANSLMTHRSEIVWVDINVSEENLFEILTSSIHSSFPVCEGELDKIIGTVAIKDLFIQMTRKRKFEIKEILQQPLFVPETMPVLELLETFKKTRTHTGLIVNEYGSLEGIVTLHDIMEAIVGDIPMSLQESEKSAVQRKDGSWLIDGSMQTDEWSELLKISDLSEKDTGMYKTIGGFMMHHLGRIPKAADNFTFRNHSFEVVDMDGKRVDKVLVKKNTSDS